MITEYYYFCIIGLSVLFFCLLGCLHYLYVHQADEHWIALEYIEQLHEKLKEMRGHEETFID